MDPDQILRDAVNEQHRNGIVPVNVVLVIPGEKQEEPGAKKLRNQLVLCYAVFLVILLGMYWYFKNTERED